ncbi:uncharacterized protein BKA78DRAFT_309872 [Phyllosticta capitalensis]|uniref:uncharacterized protein n=1 Tax=Phyllosticta capitalensis TaxID=121624 RepID=UPI00312D7ECC
MCDSGLSPTEEQYNPSNAIPETPASDPSKRLKHKKEPPKSPVQLTTLVRRMPFYALRRRWT